MPPSIFSSHSLSHFIHAIFCSLPFYPHQKFRTMLVMSSHRLFGNRKQLMVYAGTACATAFISISLPALDKSFSFQPANLLANLSFNYWNVFRFDLPTNDGSPRYFSCCLIISTPNICFMLSYVSIGVFRLKNKEVFSLLSC